MDRRLAVSSRSDKHPNSAQTVPELGALVSVVTQPTGQFTAGLHQPPSDPRLFFRTEAFNQTTHT